MSRAETIARLHREAPLLDVHAHPPLKGWLFNRRLWKRGHVFGFFDPTSSRTSFPRLTEGGFRVIWATHYIPELGLFEDSPWIRLGARIVGNYGRITGGSPFERLKASVDRLEEQVALHPDRAGIARSPGDVTRLLEREKLAVVHAVEGGHVLERDPGRLDRLAEWGVVSLTLAHFYPNGIARQVDAIPESHLIKKISSFDFFREDQPPLTDFGRDVLDGLAERGILADLTHCDPQARAAIYRHAPPSLPLVMTHVGVHAHQPVPMNPTDDELQEIARRNGAVGLIFFNYWLDDANPSAGLPALWKTLNHIHDVTGSWDHVMIGTDFDGFTTPPSEVPDASKLGAFTEMLLEKGLAEDTIRKILGGNALRIMHDRWTRPLRPERSEDG